METRYSFYKLILFCVTIIIMCGINAYIIKAPDTYEMEKEITYLKEANSFKRECLDHAMSYIENKDSTSLDSLYSLIQEEL